MSNLYNFLETITQRSMYAHRATNNSTSTIIKFFWFAFYIHLLFWF